MVKVLVVEDEASIREVIALNLRRSGMEVLEAGSAEVALALLEQAQDCSAAILDVMLPGMNGFSLCETIRRSNQKIGIIILSAKGQEQDKIRGLSIGADDYMTKPFSPEELLARIRALSRRQGDVLLEDIHWADLTLKLSSRTLHCGAKSVSLGFKEFEVLKILLANPNGIVSKEELIVKVWGSDSNAEDNNVEAYISFLRKKFFYLGSRTGIGTVRKVGYHLEENA